MRIIRGNPATGKTPKVICSGCGKRAAEAGVAVPKSAVEDGHDADGPIMMIDENQMQPLCEDCLTALERAEQR
jgi:hypothetical protein